MPWKVCSLMSQRREFVRPAQADGVNFSQLCEHFGISRKTGYKWLKRFHAKRDEGLVDHSRRPRRSPRRTQQRIDQAICELRDHHPAGGGRNSIRRSLKGTKPGSASSIRCRMTCGRWTSNVTSRSNLAAAIC